MEHLGFYRYPSITKADNVLDDIEKDLLSDLVDECELVAFTKLHGCNSAIVKHSKEGPITLQSRSRIITPIDDNAGFATAMVQHFDVVNDVLKQIESIGDVVYPLIVFGEWCGKGIQKNVALNELKDNIFVIFDIAFSAQKRWQPMEKYRSVKSLPLIRNVGELPSITFTSKRNERQACLRAIKRKVDEIDQMCPFVYHLYGLQGVGEGLVIRPKTSDNSDHWFKCKGDNHTLKVPTIEVVVDDEETKALDQFAVKHVTWERVQSAKEALHIPENTLNIMREFPRMNKWINEDIEREEADAANLDPKARKRALAKRLKEVLSGSI